MNFTTNFALCIEIQQSVASILGQIDTNKNHQTHQSQ